MRVAVIVAVLLGEAVVIAAALPRRGRQPQSRPRRRWLLHPQEFHRST